MTGTQTKREAVKQYIERLIIDGQLKIGQRLPSRNTLAAKQQMSLAPVRQAIHELTQEGVIRSEPGRRGLFVAKDIKGRPRKRTSVVVAYQSLDHVDAGAPNPLMSQLALNAMSIEAARRGETLRPMPYPPPNEEVGERSLLESIAEHGRAIFMGLDYIHWYEYLQSLGTQVVFLCRAEAPVGVNRVVWDVMEFQRLAVEHLVSLGHRRIGFIGETGSGGERSGAKFVAYFNALRDHGIISENDLVEPACGSQIEGYLAAKQLLARLDRRKWPTAIAADTDYKAIGVIAALKEAGLGIPADISVVGLDNRLVARANEMRVTTVGPNWKVLSQMLLDAIQSLSSEHPNQLISHWVQSELFIGESTAAPVAGNHP